MAKEHCTTCGIPYGEHCKHIKPIMKYVCGSCGDEIKGQCEKQYLLAGNYCRSCSGLAEKNVRTNSLTKTKFDIKELFNIK